MEKIEKTVFRNISYGMYLVTTNHHKKNGCIINTLGQITSEPPLISISLNKNNYTNEELKESKIFAISILSEETDNKIISNFGYKSGKDIDKFQNMEYEEISNLPVITDKMTDYLICEVVNILDCQTHDVFIAKVLEAKPLNNLVPMTYQYYHKVRKGTSPKNAPTYISESKENDCYRCKVCGYIYDNSKEKIKFEELPEDWICPICGEPKEMFEKIN